MGSKPLMARRVGATEIELILRSLRWVLLKPAGPGHPDNDDPVPADPDWDRIMRLCTIHRVLGFVAFALEQNKVFADLSPGVRSALTTALLESEWENRRRLSEFRRIESEFSAHGISVIPLKGIDLSLRVYRDIPFRQMGDLDLLIRERDLQAAAKFLSDRGYRLRKFPTKNRWQDAYHSRTDAPLEKIHKGRASFEKDGLDLDLHWRPRHRIGGHDIEIDADSFWRNSGSEYAPRTLALKDMLWHLILHTAEMHDPKLIQLFDLAILMRPMGQEAGAAIEERLSALEPSSRTKIERVLKGVRQVFGDSAGGSDGRERHEIVTFFLDSGNSGLFRREATRETDLSLELRPFLKRIRYVAGYLLPNPEYYAGRLKGLPMYLTHWRALAVRLKDLILGKER